MVFKKIIFQNRYVALETPSRPPPLHGKCHLKFPFWFFEPFPNAKDTNISLTLFSSLSCFDCLRAVQCTRTQGNRERVQHSKLIDFYITMPRGAKRTFQRAWTPNPQRHHRHVNCDAKRISAFTGHGVNRTARILHKLFCKRAQIFWIKGV